MKMEQTECSETLAYKILMSGNYPEESIQHSEYGESLKSKQMLHTWQFYGRRVFLQFGAPCPECIRTHLEF
jgi:hypothetical protein